MGSFDPVLRLGLRPCLPLHVVRRIGAALFQRLYMIDHLSETGAEPLAHCRTRVDRRILRVRITRTILPCASRVTPGIDSIVVTSGRIVG